MWFHKGTVRTWQRLQCRSSWCASLFALFSIPVPVSIIRDTAVCWLFLMGQIWLMCVCLCVCVCVCLLHTVSTLLLVLLSCGSHAKAVQDCDKWRVKGRPSTEEGEGFGNEGGGGGLGGSTWLTSWDSGTPVETCILHLPKNPNQFFEVANLDAPPLLAGAEWGWTLGEGGSLYV